VRAPLSSEHGEIGAVYLTRAQIAARVTELGGAVVVPPMDVEPGRFAVVADPAGAMFNVITLNPDVGR